MEFQNNHTWKLLFSKLRATLILFIFLSVFYFLKETESSPLSSADFDMIENMKAMLIAHNIHDPEFVDKMNNIQTGNVPTGRSYSDFMEQLKEYFAKYSELMSNQSGSGFQAFMGG